jgi:arginase family enzyme
MEAEFAKDMVVPETGTYRYTSANDKGTTTGEIIEYDYQSITKVYQYIVAQKLMELDIDLNSVERIVIVISLGGDHSLPIESNNSHRCPCR